MKRRICAKIFASSRKFIPFFLLAHMTLACSFGDVQSNKAGNDELGTRRSSDDLRVESRSKEASQMGPRDKKQNECGSINAQPQVVNGLTLGLSVVDAAGKTILGKVKLDCNKSIALFVHGWSLGGIPSEFMSADEWQKRGFQTLVFRWHDLSTDANAENVFVKNSKVAASRLVDALKNLNTQLGGNSFKKELRVIGHSFGAKVAAEAVARVSPLTGIEAFAAPNSDFMSRFVRVSRLTMLDPALFTNWSNGELSVCPIFKVTVIDAKKNSPAVFEEVNRIMSLLGMLTRDVKVEVFATNVASAFSFGLAELFPVQTLTRASGFDCFVSFEGLDMAEVHNSVVQGYLASIAEDAPKLETDRAVTGRLLSASVPTAEMNVPAGWYVIQSGDPRADWGKHVFRKKEIPSSFLRLNLGKTCAEQGQSEKDCRIALEFVLKL